MTSPASEDPVLKPKHDPVRLSFSGLPPELVYHTFELGAGSDLKFAAILCRVCKWTKALASPYLYRMVRFGDTGPVDGNIDSLRANGVLTNGLAYSIFEALLKWSPFCPNISHIFTRTLYPLMVILNSTCIYGTPKTPLHLTSFDELEGSVPPAEVRDPCFLSRISHFTVNSFDAFSTMALLQYLNNLTHFAFSPRSTSPPLCSILKHLDGLPGNRRMQLQCIVLFHDQAYALQESTESWQSEMLQRRKTDKRLFVAGETCINRAIEEWEGEIWGGKTIWDRAKAYTAEIEAKNQG